MMRVDLTNRRSSGFLVNHEARWNSSITKLTAASSPPARSHADPARRVAAGIRRARALIG
jgi:hypothetical protein